MRIRALLSACVAAFGLIVSPVAHAGDYVLKATHRIAGEGGWDYLSYDASSNRLYVTRGTRIQVVDPDSGQLVAEIPDTPGVHGVALALDLGKGYTSNGRGNSITVFDLDRLRTLTQVATPDADNPDFIVYDAVSRRVFAFNGRSHDASVIDATTDRIVATIALAGKPESAVVDGRGKVFVAIEDRNEIQVIDARSAHVNASWTVTGCDEPAGLAIDTESQRLFVGCHNRVMAIVSSEAGATVATLPIGAGVDAVVFDTLTKQAFSSQGDGTLTVVRAETGDRFSVQQTVATPSGARTMALNPRTHELYLVTAEYDETAGANQPGVRRTMRPGTFRLLVLAPQAN